MRFNMIAILLKKDFLDLMKNMSVLPILFMAPLLSLLFSKLNVPGDSMPPMWILYGIAMVGIMLPGLTVAEEKEKGTLDSLLVSPATYLEVVAGKVIFTLGMTLIVCFLTLLPSGFKGNQLVLWTGIFICSVFFTQIGLIIGLFTKNQISAGAYMTPAMLFFILIPVFKEVVPKFLQGIFDTMPSIAFMDLAFKSIKNQGLEGVATSLLILIAWNVVAYVFTHLGIRHQFR